MTDVGTIVALVGLAGFLALDATAALQIMLSQPIVAGALAGVVCGQFEMGVVVGGILQLVWLGALPVGAASFPDAPVGTVAGVGAAWILATSGHEMAWCVGLGTTWAIVVGALGGQVVAALRRINVRLSDDAAAGVEAGRTSAVTRAVGLGLLVRFAGGAAMAALALGVVAASSGHIRLPLVRGQFPGFVWAAPLAAAVVAQRSRTGTERALLAAGFAAGLIIVALG